MKRGQMSGQMSASRGIRVRRPVQAGRSLDLVSGGPRRATKIVATIGKNADDPGALEALLAAGVDVVRLNGAHCGPGEIRARVALVRRIEKKLGRPFGILLDLGGPKIRVGPVADGALTWS